MALRPDDSEIRKVLRKVPHFRDGSFEALDAATACFQLRQVPEGEVVLSKGSPGDALFFILEGTFVAQIPPDRQVIMEAEDFFGEIGLLLGVERTTSVMARTPGRLLVLPGEHLARIFRVFPRLRKAMEEKALSRAPELMEALNEVSKKSQPKN